VGVEGDLLGVEEFERIEKGMDALNGLFRGFIVPQFACTFRISLWSYLNLGPFSSAKPEQVKPSRFRPPVF
jgi:hypothetical protein